MQVINFTKVKLPFGWLGNMASFAITWECQEWRSSEAVFQAMRFDDPAIREAIREEKSPMAAKIKAKANADKMTVTPLSDQDLKNMDTVLRLKLKQHPDLAMQLLKTGDALIVEDVSGRPSGGNHRFWGAALENGQWVGRNQLGTMWMALRTELRNLLTS